MTQRSEIAADEVDFVSGSTRILGIVGDPIQQVRSPEMFTAELVQRGYDAILIPLHVRPPEFGALIEALRTLVNLDGLIFTIPYKAQAMRFADEVGPQARAVGAINALARTGDGRWKAEIFDGLGCVAGLRKRGHELKGARVMLIGAGGAGSAIGVAVATEHPASMRLFDPDAERASQLAGRIRSVAPNVAVEIGTPSVAGCDFLLNASPVGMNDDPRMPIDVTALPAELVVFDAIVKPERTPLIALAERCGCRTVYGREMMRGQLERMVDFFGFPHWPA